MWGVGLPYLGGLHDANQLRNSTGQGASTSPSTLPTGWQIVAANGLTTTVTALSSTEIVIRVNGTPSATTAYILAFGNTTDIPNALRSQIWRAEITAGISSGAKTNITQLTLDIQERNAGGALADGGTNILTPLAATPAIFQHTRTLTNAATTLVRSRLQIGCTAGAAIDISLSLVFPQVLRRLA